VNPSPPKRKPPRNYFSRREQVRLLVLVMLFGAVILLMKEASQVENWYWLTGEEADTPQKPATASPPDYDTSYQVTLPALDRETVRITPPDALQAGENQRYFPGVNSQALKHVKDNRTHQHPEEAAAWFNLWHTLENNESRLIDAASIGPVTFGQLFEQPEVFRGHLVTLRGRAHRSEWVAAAKNNSAGVTGYYRLILKLRNGPNRPVFLYVLSLPKSFPVGDHIDAEIETTGFFYKNWLYEASGVSWIGPVVLARDLRWLNPTPLTDEENPSPLLMVGLSGIIVAFGWTLWALFVRRKKRSNAISTRQKEAQAQAIERLDSIAQAPPIGEQLRNLAAGQRAEHPQSDPSEKPDLPAAHDSQKPEPRG
jgi:hypothetical protein